MMPIVPPLFSTSASRAPRVVLWVCASALLAACGPPPAPQTISDPLESQNRANHKINVAIDRYALKPVATAYGDAVPGPGREVVSNIGDNVELPSDIVDGLLQGNVEGALKNTLRFGINTALGIGGIFDPATAMGVLGDPTDFGETLHVWGVKEGNYVELPVIGPTTERDLMGRAVDVFLNPLRFILPTAEANWATGFQIAANLEKRSRYSDSIDSVIYDSADSYAQTRLLYIQNRRFELGQAVENDNFEDPYEDPYGN